MTTIYLLLKDTNKYRKLIINKVDDFFNLALHLIEDEDFIYRGINSDEQKCPKIIRDKDCSMFEAGFLQEFERYFGLYSRTPNFWEFIALAQHTYC